jgi:hypothetical protein
MSPKTVALDARCFRLLNDNLGEFVGFESSYPMSRPSGAHVATMDRKDVYVSVVTSLNTWFV